MQSMFGIAKNVNGRRVATAYHLGGSGSGSGGGAGRVSNSTAATPIEQQLPGSDGVILSMMKTPQASSLVSSLSSSSLASLGGLESGTSSGSNSRLGTPTANGNANVELTRLDSTPFLNIKYDQEQDWHVSKHGSVVDKTNPFIGYFQTGRDSPSSTPLPSGLPPRSTSGTGPSSIREVTTPYAALLSQPKRIADWIGSQSTRLPSLFTKREQGDKQTSAQTQQFGEPSDKEEIKGLSLLSSLKAAAASLGASSKKDAEQRSPQQKSLLPQTELFSLQTTASSRLAQDFELVESLGQGGQGTVFKARSKIDGRFYAIKKVALSNTVLDDVTELEQARREAVSMAAIPPHSNVVRYHTAWIEVEPVESITSSTASVRGSDVPDEDEEELGLEHSGQHPNDVSFSVTSSVSDYVNFENSFGGFEFEDPSQSMMSYTNDNNEDESSSDSEKEKLAGVGKSKLTLYIQMELCGTSVGSPVREDETFDRFVDRLKQVASPPPQEQYSNLTQWLRSSVDERSAENPSSRGKHAEGLKLFLGVAQGVSHMHSVGVIHRDLKPDNIFIHGEVAKVGDFGLSKSIFADSSRTVVQQARDFENSDEYGDHTTALGTFTYASPEQLGHRFNSSKDTSRVKSAKYSIKSDIFALGVILLELCCPFGTMMERSQVLTAVRHGVVPQKALQRYPSEMALVLRMTAVDPAER